MSQASCERYGLPVPMRWPHAGGDRARSDRVHPCPDRPLLPSQSPPRCPAQSLCRPCVPQCRSPRATAAHTIELGANIKSP
jgi:hypothetical protein